MNRLSRRDHVELLEFLIAEKNSDILGNLKEPLKPILARADAGLTPLIAEIAGFQKWQDYVAPLQAVFPKLTADQIEARTAVAIALEGLGKGLT